MGGIYESSKPDITSKRQGRSSMPRARSHDELMAVEAPECVQTKGSVAMFLQPAPRLDAIRG